MNVKETIPPRISSGRVKDCVWPRFTKLRAGNAFCRKSSSFINFARPRSDADFDKSARSWQAGDDAGMVTFKRNKCRESLTDIPGNSVIHENIRILATSWPRSTHQRSLWISALPDRNRGVEHGKLQASELVPSLVPGTDQRRNHSQPLPLPTTTTAGHCPGELGSGDLGSERSPVFRRFDWDRRQRS